MAAGTATEAAALRLPQWGAMAGKFRVLRQTKGRTVF